MCPQCTYLREGAVEEVHPFAEEEPRVGLHRRALRSAPHGPDHGVAKAQGEVHGPDLGSLGGRHLRKKFRARYVDTGERVAQWVS